MYFSRPKLDIVRNFSMPSKVLLFFIVQIYKIFQNAKIGLVLLVKSTQ